MERVGRTLFDMSAVDALNVLGALAVAEYQIRAVGNLRDQIEADPTSPNVPKLLDLHNHAVKMTEETIQTIRNLAK